MAHSEDSRIVVPIIFFGCHAYVRKAVESILGQTHRDLQLVVVNDGDPEPPWEVLADLDDPRLWRVDIRQNNGTYFGVSAVLYASSCPYLAIQDADDWSEDIRLETLLGALRVTDLSAVASAQVIHYEGDLHRVDGVGPGVRLEEYPHSVSRRPTARLRTYYRHHALFRSQWLKGIGGYYGGFRVSYDVLITAVTHLCGRMGYVGEPLYHRVRRPGSLTTHPETGSGSAYRETVDRRVREIYASVFRAVDGRAELDLERVSHLMRQDLTAADERRLAACAGAMAPFLATPSTRVHTIDLDATG